MSDRAEERIEAVKVVEEVKVEFERVTPDQLRKWKLELLNVVSSSLIKEPRFNSGDPTTIAVKRLVKVKHLPPLHT